jgi:hypothetical protein
MLTLFYGTTATNARLQPRNDPTSPGLLGRSNFLTRSSFHSLQATFRMTYSKSSYFSFPNCFTKFAADQCVGRELLMSSWRRKRLRGAVNSWWRTARPMRGGYRGRGRDQCLHILLILYRLFPHIDPFLNLQNGPNMMTEMST